MGFKDDMKRAERKINEAAEKTMRGAALEIFSEIVRRTPVGNPALWDSKPPVGYAGGTLRGNWQANLNAPSLSTIDAIDKAGAATISRAGAELSNFTVNSDSIWFSNNLPYAMPVERGSSTQAPNGMVRTTIKAFKPVINKFARINKI